MKNQVVMYEIEFSGMIVAIPVTIEANSYNDAAKLAEKEPNVYLTRAFKQFFEVRQKDAKKAPKGAKKTQKKAKKVTTSKRVAREIKEKFETYNKD